MDSLPHEMQTVLQTASAMGDALSSKALRDVHRQLDMKPEGPRLDARPSPPATREGARGREIRRGR